MDVAWREADVGRGTRQCCLLLDGVLVEVVVAESVVRTWCESRPCSACGVDVRALAAELVLGELRRQGARRGETWVASLGDRVTVARLFRGFQCVVDAAHTNGHAHGATKGRA